MAKRKAASCHEITLAIAALVAAIFYALSALAL
jgi:hypothetical protein